MRTIKFQTEITVKCDDETPEDVERWLMGQLYNIDDIEDVSVLDHEDSDDG